jgi:MoxR-like ATPase
MIGQRWMVDRMIVAVLTERYVLLEIVPELGKTLAIKSLATAVWRPFQNIRFMIDMLPAAIIGTQIENQKLESFAQKGPIFANLVLADEINRTPAEVQSALLESIQELQVTISREKNKLRELFIVFAIGNPIEYAGIYSLPDSQVEKFVLKLRIEYLSKREEMKISDSAVKISK